MSSTKRSSQKTKGSGFRNVSPERQRAYAKKGAAAVAKKHASANPPKVVKG